MTTLLDHAATIIQLRSEGASWVKVGLAIHRQPGDVRKFATATLGMPVSVLVLKTGNDYERRRMRWRLKQIPDARSDFSPYPPGHPETWGVISATPWRVLGVFG